VKAKNLFKLLPFERQMLLDLVFDEKVHEELWRIQMRLEKKTNHWTFFLLSIYQESRK